MAEAKTAAMFSSWRTQRNRGFQFRFCGFQRNRDRIGFQNFGVGLHVPVQLAGFLQDKMSPYNGRLLGTRVLPDPVSLTRPGKPDFPGKTHAPKSCKKILLDLTRRMSLTQRMSLEFLPGRRITR